MALAAAALAALIVVGCSSGDQTVEGPVTVYVSLPLTGPRAADGNDAADGARLALEQAGGLARGLEVNAEILDDSSGAAAWDPVLVGRNARAATQDSTTAAYIGELDSEPTRASAPITNEAGIVQISPGAGGADLTGTAAGYPDAPNRYRPSGDATFARVVPADDVVARAAVSLAAEDALFARIVSDGSLYGDLTAAEMTRAADSAGLGLRPTGKVDAVLYAGGPDGVGEAAKAAAESGARIVVATDAVGPAAVELPDAGDTFVVAAALDRRNLPDPDFDGAFRSEFGRDPGPYAAYGYEAMQLALAGIASAEGEAEFRPAIRDAVIGASREGADSVLGPFTIDEEGDADLCAVQRYRVTGSSVDPAGASCAE